MSVHRGIHWKMGLWGAIAGALLGLVILLVLNLHSAVTETTAPRPVIVGAEPRDTDLRGVDGNVQVLGDAEGGSGVPDGISKRGRVQYFIVAAYLGDYEIDKAIDAANAMDRGIDRDTALQDIAEKVVPRSYTINPHLLPTNQPKQREEKVKDLRRLVQIAETITNPEIEARLLVRAAIVKRSLDLRNPGPPIAAESDLDPQTLFNKVSAIAATIPKDAVKSRFFVELYAYLTGALTLLGFVVPQLFQPTLDSAGKAIDSQVSRLVQAVLPERFRSSHDHVAENDHPPAETEKV
jgi:hypothetical protein